ncbi:MAG: hypothetical protein ACYCPT_13775 [Acidimicrobiales bacterium]
MTRDINELAIATRAHPLSNSVSRLGQCPLRRCVRSALLIDGLILTLNNLAFHLKQSFCFVKFGLAGENPLMPQRAPDGEVAVVVVLLFRVLLQFLWYRVHDATPTGRHLQLA